MWQGSMVTVEAEDAVQDSKGAANAKALKAKHTAEYEAATKTVKNKVKGVKNAVAKFKSISVKNKEGKKNEEGKHNADFRPIVPGEEDDSDEEDSEGTMYLE
jgi:hypothetical protein